VLSSSLISRPRDDIKIGWKYIKEHVAANKKVTCTPGMADIPWVGKKTDEKYGGNKAG